MMNLQHLMRNQYALAVCLFNLQTAHTSKLDIEMNHSP